MSACGIKPENSLRPCGCLTLYAEAYPVLNRRFPHSGRAPNITRLNILFMQYIAIFQNVTYGSIGRNFKSRGVAAVFLCLLRHQPNICNRARGCRVQCPCLFEIVNCLVIDRGITAIRYDAFGVALLSIWAPSLATCTNNSWHRSINNDIRGHVKVGNPFVTIHHIHRCFTRQNSLKICENVR